MACKGWQFLAVLTVLSLQFNVNYAQTYVYHFCLGVNYTANSTFQANLQLLLSSISNNTAPSNNNIFFNNIVGRNQDRAYGLFQCRGDFGAEKCKRCAESAAGGIMNRCPYNKEAILWYDECSLHYSDTSFLSTVLLDPAITLRNSANVSDLIIFRQKRTELMNRLVEQAVSNSSNLFAIGTDNITSSDLIYGLVQCTQDISPRDCRRCLTIAVSRFPSCCDNNPGGRSITPSCITRYETYDFFEANALTPAPPLPRITPPTNRNNTSDQEKKSSTNIVAIVVPIVTITALILIVAIFFFITRKKDFQIVNSVDELTSPDSLQLDFGTVATATENFSENNRLGEGGFGVVYKGKLSDGQEIAVKRLSINSGQGVGEFKNEVLLLAKLQHRNLVRLFGFCLEGVEKLLIYEFVSNSSLDKFLFDPVKCAYLNWERRYKIIGGIARGLLYLHEDSRDTIIHRDLKASNVLLDAQMNPKISDFGLAKLVLMDQTQGTTSRVVGTYGYMSPEYAMHGQFSVKSDVFSFGVLVLEIITGQRNSSSYVSERAEDLLSHAWRQWEKGNVQDLLHPSLREDYSATELMRCVHMGLLCVQEDVVKRPTMATIVLMLNSYSVTLPLPSAPGFFLNTLTKNVDTISEGFETNTTVTQDRSVSSSTLLSVNDISISELYAR